MMYIINRDYLIETSRSLPLDKITIGDMDPTMIGECERKNATVVLLLDDTNKLNAHTASKVLRTVKRQSDNGNVVTPEEYERIRKNAEKRAMQQVRRILMMNRVPKHTIDKYIKLCTEQKTWNPKDE